MKSSLPGRLAIAAILCGLLPLVAGCGIFAAWAWYRYWVLQSAGFYTLAIGTVLFLIGWIALIVASKQARKITPVPGGDFRRKSIWAAILLSANLPAAAGCVIGAIALESSGMPVEIQNLSGLVLEDAQIDYVAGGPLLRSRLATGEKWCVGLREPNPAGSSGDPAPMLTGKLGGTPIRLNLPYAFQEGRWAVNLYSAEAAQIKQR